MGFRSCLIETLICSVRSSPIAIPLDFGKQNLMIFFNLILDRRCMHRYLIYKRSESSIEIYFYFCRDITSEILSERPEGSFVVRQSTSRPDCFALSVRVPNGSIAHYLINAVQCTEKSFYRIQVHIEKLLS